MKAVIGILLGAALLAGGFYLYERGRVQRNLREAEMEATLYRTGEAAAAKRSIDAARKVSPGTPFIKPDDLEDAQVILEYVAALEAQKEGHKDKKEYKDYLDVCQATYNLRMKNHDKRVTNESCLEAKNRYLGWLSMQQETKRR